MSNSKKYDGYRSFQYLEEGVDYAIVIPFTIEFSHLSAEAFVMDILRARYGMSELLIGHDHGFGRGRSGDIDVLRSLGAAGGFGVDVVPPVAASDGRVISSTFIRRASLVSAMS